MLNQDQAEIWGHEAILGKQHFRELCDSSRGEKEPKPTNATRSPFLRDFVEALINPSRPL